MEKKGKKFKLLGITENHLYSALHVEGVCGVGPKDPSPQYKLKQLEE